MSQQAILQTTDLHFSYGKRCILQNINLKASKGDVIGIVGPNGAGKTTLLRLVSGHLKPDKGSIDVTGRRLETLRPRDKAKLIALVPQSPTQPDGFTAFETVLMGRNPYIGLFGWENYSDLETCQKAMTLTSTWDLAHRPISSLSAGELQRVFIARALSQEAPILLLDEPTANLDLAHQSEVMNTICLVQQQVGGAVLVAMHDLTLASQYCNRFIMLSAGAVFADGPPEQVLTPSSIQSVYGVEVSLISHPQSGTPVVLPAARSERNIIETTGLSTNGHSTNKTGL